MDTRQLTANWLAVFLLAVPGLLLSVLVVAALLHFGLGLSWLLALLLGAMISPTDPIAVLALLRELGLSDRLRTIVEGESLFNDGVGAAIYELVLGVLLASLAMNKATQDLCWEVMGDERVCQSEQAQITFLATARPATRPEKRHPPKNVPSRAR